LWSLATHCKSCYGESRRLSVRGNP
jgi:hypothetical protein